MTDLSPRQWGKGDPEPSPLVQLRDQRGDRLIHDQGKWVFVECDGEQPEVYDSGASWAELDKLYDIEWPLTEVLPEPATPWEPQIGDRVVGKLFSHPEDDIEGEFRGHMSGGPVSILVIGAMFGCSVLRSTLRPVPQQPQDAPISSSVRGGDSETVTDELRAWAKKVHMVLLSFYGDNATADQQDHVASMTRAIVQDAPPPSTQDETEWQWGYRFVDCEDPESVDIADNEADARRAVRNYPGDRPVEVVRRPGPWVSVSSVEGTE